MEMSEPLHSLVALPLGNYSIFSK